MYGGQSTYIPLKINQAGVIAIIFASSVLFLPALLVQVVPWDWRQSFVNDYILDTTNWLHLLLYGLLIIGFSYFYNSIAFSPEKQADQLRKQGGFIPGIRPVPQTERYLRRVLNRFTLPGSIFIAIIALLPSHRAGRRQRHAVPVRRHHRADRRRRGPRDHEADRQPADDAELRGLPEVTDGPAWPEAG